MINLEGEEEAAGLENQNSYRERERDRDREKENGQWTLHSRDQI
jgi:hypothetical protein